MTSEWHERSAPWGVWRGRYYRALADGDDSAVLAAMCRDALPPILDGAPGALVRIPVGGFITASTAPNARPFDERRLDVLRECWPHVPPLWFTGEDVGHLLRVAVERGEDEVLALLTAPAPRRDAR